MNRRGFLFGGATLLAAPSIVRVSNLMSISMLKPNYVDALAASFETTKERYAAKVLYRISQELYAGQFHPTNLGLLESFRVPSH